MKRYVLTVSLLCWILLCGFAPAHSNFIDLYTRELGTVRMYVNPQYSDGYFSISADKPVNIYGSTITGYILNSDGVPVYQVNCLPYGQTWTYRATSGNYGSTNLNVLGYEPSSSTVIFAGVTHSRSELRSWVMLAFVAVCAAMLFRKSTRG